MVLSWCPFKKDCNTCTEWRCFWRKYKHMGCIVVCVQCSARPYGNAIKHILSYLIKSYMNGSKVRKNHFSVMLDDFFFAIPPSLNLNMYLRSGFPIPLHIKRVLDIARLVPWPAHISFARTRLAHVQADFPHLTRFNLAHIISVLP